MLTSLLGSRRLLASVLVAAVVAGVKTFRDHVESEQEKARRELLASHEHRLQAVEAATGVAQPRVVDANVVEEQLTEEQLEELRAFMGAGESPTEP